jgi:Flp pilus assembly protein TadG
MKAAGRQDGAVMVEFALVLVPLLFLVFGFLQFGLAMNAKIDATHLSAEGARYVAVNQNPGAPGTSMQDYIRNQGDVASVRNGTVTICYPTNSVTGTSAKVGDPVRVKVTPTSQTAFSGTLPLIGAVGGLALPTLAVSSDTTMRLEAVPADIPQAGPCP